jgi:formylglycine-generating enzyme required for sulfatase activity
VDPTVERPASEAAAQAFEELVDHAVRFPSGVFQLGARLEDLPRPLRALDVRERLALGALLRPTPARWVYLLDFSLAARPVTNGEYLRFLEDPGYEDPARWQRVFEDHAIDQVDHYTLRDAGPEGGDLERLKKTWESYAGVRSYLLALVRSVVHEVERELDLSPRFAEKRSVWDETRAIDRPKAGELSQITALFARALGPYMPQDYRRDLAPDERERLAALDAGAQGDPAVRKVALEALDSLLGRLRDRYLDALRRDGPARVAADFERSLVERDYSASDCQIAALKILDRLRNAYVRGESARIPLRKIMYPLTWPSEDPRGAQRDRPDRLPWEERPVNGISLYEALAYADWLTRAAGEKALVRLPSEAQLERASSWPVLPAEPRQDGGLRETVDARWKVLFPWEARSPEDPAAFAPGEDGEPVRSFHQLFAALDRPPFDLDIRELRELVRRSSRTVGEKRIEMLLGFQWEWTRDRLSELEPGYEQLERAEPLGREHEAYERGKTRPVPATYYCGSSRRGSWFAARGGPRRLGGSGLTTRRFGLYPLRGAPEVGFRLVVEPLRRASLVGEARP